MMFITGEELRDWARGASPGASRTLGEGAALPSATGAIVASLSDAKVIDIVRRKIAAERYSFIVQRRTGRYVDRAARRISTMPQVRRGVYERRILKILIAAAAKGLPCPTNGVLARLVGLSGEVAASYRLRRLVAAGKIRVAVPDDPRQHRVVTIVATGKTTRGGAR